MGKPILGICLGAQFLFSKSFEHGNFNGLNLLSGNVVHLKNIEKNNSFVVPNIGWYEIEKLDHKLFDAIPEYSKFYFIHSYNFQPTEKNILSSKLKIQISMQFQSKIILLLANFIQRKVVKLE